MSDSIRVPNYNGGAEPLYLYRFASDLVSYQDALHQSMYVRQILGGETWDDYGSESSQTIIGEAYATVGAYWAEFSTVSNPDTCTVEIRGAKMPIKLIVIDDLDGETEYNMGNSNTSQLLTPPTGRQYVDARIIRRF